jgi:hypothetical protein
VAEIDRLAAGSKTKVNVFTYIRSETVIQSDPTSLKLLQSKSISSSLSPDLLSTLAPESAPSEHASAVC